MGTVYMAEQTAPVERKVALKIIKPGMDSRLVIARFEAERQALALMDHPNIAKMLDAGTTENGRPYFVMELVKGIPIIQYCDEHHFTPRQRLELFISVCQAVQHAHQKGIIHRDLKPTNILVADYDDHPVPKIIDFGVAKALGQHLTDKTIFTEFGQVIGTVEYMSPEQAKLNQLDIDTRTDIYSLGVLLYELLSGETPFDRAAAAHCRAGRNAADHSRGRAPQAEHSIEQKRVAAINRRQSATGAQEVGDRALRRFGLDRDALPGKRSPAPLRNRRRPGRRSAALFDRPAGRRSAAHSRLPAEKVHPPEQTRRTCGNSGCRGACDWPGRFHLFRRHRFARGQACYSGTGPGGNQRQKG